MRRNQVGSKNKLKTMLVLSLAGCILYLALCMLWAMFMLREKLPEMIISLSPQISLLVALLAVCCIAGAKSRGGEREMIFIPAIILLLFSCGIGTILSVGAANIKKTVFVITIGILVPFILSIVKNKNSKLHKRR